MKPYLYLAGLRRLAKESRGDETIHLGIRPYGFHAGNAMALIVYPYLLCKFTEELGKTPRFTFIVSLNDWEQDELDGPDYRKYPFNIYPKNSSLEFTPDERPCHKSIIAHWGPVIKKNVGMMKKRFPKLTFRFIKNSHLIQYPFCRNLLLETIRHPRGQAGIFKKYSGKQVLPKPLQYAGAICPKCRSAHGKTVVVGKNIHCKNIHWKCSNCGATAQGKPGAFAYWWYHKPMLIARIAAFKIDVTLSGGDHFSEGDFKIRRAFLKKYAPTVKEPKMVFTPTIIALNGQKMSKSRNNAAFANVRALMKSSYAYKKAEFRIPKNFLKKKIDGKDYSRIF